MSAFRGSPSVALSNSYTFDLVVEGASTDTAPRLWSEQPGAAEDEIPLRRETATGWLGHAYGEAKQISPGQPAFSFRLKLSHRAGARWRLRVLAGRGGEQVSEHRGVLRLPRQSLAGVCIPGGRREVLVPTHNGYMTPPLLVRWDE